MERRQVKLAHWLVLWLKLIEPVRIAVGSLPDGKKSINLAVPPRQLLSRMHSFLPDLPMMLQG